MRNERRKQRKADKQRRKQQVLNRSATTAAITHYERDGRVEYTGVVVRNGGEYAVGRLMNSRDLDPDLVASFSRLVQHPTRVNMTEGCAQGASEFFADIRSFAEALQARRDAGDRCWSCSTADEVVASFHVCEGFERLGLPT